MRGFMHNHRRDQFDSRRRIGHVSLVKDAGVERMSVFADAIKYQRNPNSLEFADEASNGLCCLISSKAPSTRIKSSGLSLRLPIHTPSRCRPVDIDRFILSPMLGRT